MLFSFYLPVNPQRVVCLRIYPNSLPPFRSLILYYRCGFPLPQNPA